MNVFAPVAIAMIPQRIREIGQAAISATAEQPTREQLLADVRWIFDGKPEIQQDVTIQRE
jgi:hypothetical protein